MRENRRTSPLLRKLLREKQDGEIISGKNGNSNQMPLDRLKLNRMTEYSRTRSDGTTSCLLLLL